MEREELIKMSNVKFQNEKDVLKTLFMSNVMKAKHRNDGLKQELISSVKFLDDYVKYKQEPTKKFDKLEVVN